MAEISTTSSNKKSAGVKKSKKLDTRVDLTPMVDLGFLLVTFFVFTSSMSEAKAMSIYEPANAEVSNPVVASGAMTILMSENNRLFYYYGRFIDAKQNAQINATTYEELRELINQKRIETELDDLMFIIKSDGSSTLKNTVDVL